MECPRKDPLSYKVVAVLKNFHKLLEAEVHCSQLLVRYTMKVRNVWGLQSWEHIFVGLPAQDPSRFSMAGVKKVSHMML